MIIKFVLKNIYKIVMLSLLILFSRLFQIGYKIDNFNYLIIILIYSFTLIIYWFYKIILKKTIYKIIITSFSLIIILILSFLYVHNPYTLIYNSFVNNFINIRSAYLDSFSIDFFMLIPFLIIIIPTTIIIIFSFKDRVPFITLIVTLPIMYLLWYNNCSLKLYTNIYIMLSCFDLGINIHFSSLRKAKRSNYKFLISLNHNILYVAIMVVLTASFTHFAGETFGIKSIKEFNDDRRAAIINEVNSIENIYGLANSGYGSNSYILGGPIKINYNLAIKVKSSRPLYLRGKVLDYYDGTGWSNNSDDYYMFNTTPTSKLVKSEEIEISPQTLVTSTLLAPLNTFSVVSSGSNVMYNNSNIFMVGNKSNVTIPYTVKFALNEDEKLDNDVAYGKDISEKYKKYLQVPNNITPKTYNLVNALLKDCKTNEEKIDKINKYLIENYKYSLQVSNVPKDNEFLDYFLFTEKKGYCTYFATAATIFTRIAGIPARYVEGFSMDNTMDTNGVYLVGNNRAHAWTEILTSPSNDAWRTFDCTPGYLDNNQEHKVIIPSTNSKDIKTKDGETQTKAVKNNRIKKLPIINVSFLFIILCLGIALFLLVLGMFFIRIKRWMKNRNKILGCNGVIPLYYYSKKRLNTIGIRWSATLSDEEGALGLKDEELRIHFINIVKVFYEEYYGDTFDKSFNKLLFYKYLEEYVKKNSGFFKYYYYKIK